ncbi:hypothetical protein Q3G72_028954 [Acer saccharum]|nr:hypothetical protein Q3G72_028954 [Acer saccharum]
MASNKNQLHFVLIPLLCPGHLLPMVDIARLLAQHGVKITLIVTPLNAILFDKIINRDTESGLSIQLLQIPFPWVEAGLPEGYEDLSALPSRSLAINFFDALRMMQQPMEKFVEETHPRPSCIISDRHLPWTIDITSKFGIPRLAFDGTSCFSFMCSHNISISKVHENVTSDSDYFVVPNLPDKIELTKAQLPSFLNPGRINVKGFYEEIKAADMASYGLVINSFEELESRYVEECKKVKGDKIIVKVLRIGESVGANVASKWGEEDKYGVKVKSEKIRKAIDLVMDEEEGEEKRKRTRELGDLANKALEEGGSSYCNIRLLIKDIMQQVMDNKAIMA